MPLDFEYSFGFEQSNRSVAFFTEHTVALTAGKLCIVLDLDTGLQRSYQITEKDAISAVQRIDIFILAAISSVPPSVCSFQIISEQKRLYVGPRTIQNEQFVALSLSKSHSHIAAVTGGPSQTIVIWQANSSKPLTTLKPYEGSCGTVNDLSFSPSVGETLVVTGEKVFKLYEFKADGDTGSLAFVQRSFGKYEKKYTYFSIAWSMNGYLAVGASSGLILFFRGTEFSHKMAVFYKLKHCLQHMDREDCLELETSLEVTKVCTASQMLVCLLSGVVIMVYKGNGNSQYKFVRYILLPSNDPSKANIRKDLLITISISPEGSKLVGVTEGGQLLYCRNIAKPGERRETSFLTHVQHNEPITIVDTAVGRPLIASASQYFLILWNHKKRTQLMRIYYRQEIAAMALHPSGLFLALGFEKFAAAYNILHRELSDKQHITFKNCTQLKFSTTGHLLAVAGECHIDVYLFHRQEHVHRFSGHAGHVMSMDWRVNDSVLVSCDDSGVTSAWNVSDFTQIWEQTAEVSYTSVTTNSEGDVVAVGLNRNVVCIRDGSIKWNMKTKKELTCIVFHEKTKLFYAGTKEGCIVSLSLPSPEAKEIAYLHNGEVTSISMVVAQSILVSVSRGGLVMLTRVADGSKEDSEEYPSEIYSTLTLVEPSEIKQYQDRLNEIDQSIGYIKNMDACEREVNAVQHEREVRELVFKYEKMINSLNDNIFLAKEAIQLRRLEGEQEPEETKLEKQLDQEVMDLTSKLGEAYQKTLDLGKENAALRLEYEISLRDLNAGHETAVNAERMFQEMTKQKIKDLEKDLLQKEQQVIDTLKELENLRSCFENANYENDISSKTVNEPLKAEKQRFTDLKEDKERLKQKKKFRIEDNRMRRNVATGQVDYDIQEKMNAITYLESEFKKLESSLRMKEKFVQYQEKKFGSTRTLVSFLRKKSIVAKTELQELDNAISSKESQIETRRQEFKDVQDAIPAIEDDLEIVNGLTETVTEKFQETNEGLRQKREMLRGTQEVLAKYTTMLHRCLSREYDLHDLVVEITKLFDDSRIDFADEADPRLNREYLYQIEQLKKAYEMIKNEPADATRQKAMAEFRLSQENSKILNEVHEIQKEDEKLRTTLGLMEGTLMLHLGSVRKSGEKEGGDMRSKIEFVANFRRKSKFVSIEMLDKFIEEQQEEIVRFQNELEDKGEM